MFGVITAKQIASSKEDAPNELSDLRAKFRLSLREIAEATGISLSTVWRAEIGRDIMLSDAMILALFFDCTVDEIWKKQRPRNARRGQPEPKGKTDDG